jgi:hypothetical protein
MKIRGIEGMSPDQVQFEIQRGAKPVVYRYCVSLLLVTFRRASDVYYIPAGENAVANRLPWRLLSLAAGRWGIPWGPIFTRRSLITNFKGGKDLTAEIGPHLFRTASAPMAGVKA